MFGASVLVEIRTAVAVSKNQAITSTISAKAIKTQCHHDGSLNVSLEDCSVGLNLVGLMPSVALSITT